MKKIALTGEDPNDTNSIKNLLAQKFEGKAHFNVILRNKKGYQLDSIAFKKALLAELKLKQYDSVIFIRDLDGLRSEEKKFNQKMSWFKGLNEIANNKGCLLLNIYELEALVLADIETFNKIYQTDIRNVGNVMFIEKPKEFLVRKTAKTTKPYSVNHCPDLFKVIRYDTLKSNCAYFKDFTAHFEELMSN